MTTSPLLANGNSINVVKERQQTTNDERRKCCESVVEERGIWPEIGTVLQKERSVQSVESMDILLCGKASKQQRISSGRPCHIANFVGNQEDSGTDDDCAFAFMVTQTKEEICHTISCDEPVIEICVDGISTKAFIDTGFVSNLVGMRSTKSSKHKVLMRS